MPPRDAFAQFVEDFPRRFKGEVLAFTESPRKVADDLRIGPFRVPRRIDAFLNMDDAPLAVAHNAFFFLPADSPAKSTSA